MTTGKREKMRRVRAELLVSQINDAITVSGKLADFLPKLEELAALDPSALTKLLDAVGVSRDQLPRSIRGILEDQALAIAGHHDVTVGCAVDRVHRFHSDLSKRAVQQLSESSVGSDEIARSLLPQQILMLMCFCGISDRQIVTEGLLELVRSEKLLKVSNRAYLSVFLNDDCRARGQPTHKPWLIGWSSQIVRGVARNWDFESLQSYLSSDDFERQWNKLFANYPRYKGGRRSGYRRFREDLKKLIHATVEPEFRDLYASVQGPISTPLSDEAERNLVSKEHVRPRNSGVDPSAPIEGLPMDEVYRQELPVLSDQKFSKGLNECFSEAEKTCQKKGGSSGVQGRSLLLCELTSARKLWSEEYRLTAGQLALLVVLESLARDGTPNTSKDASIGGLGRIRNYDSGIRDFFLVTLAGQDIRAISEDVLVSAVNRYLQFDPNDGSIDPKSPECQPGLRIALERLYVADWIDEFPYIEALHANQPFRLPDVVVISYDDYLSIIELLNAEPDDFERYRAILMSMLGLHGAARFTEAFHLYGNELMVFDDLLEIDFRSHGCHTLKTSGSNGRVVGLFPLTELEKEAVGYFKSRVTSSGLAEKYLFHGQDSDYWGAEVARVRSLMRRAFRAATGRKDMRFHAFRHTFANQRAMVMWAPEFATEWFGSKLPDIEPAVDPALLPNGVRQNRRSLVLRRSMRHADEATTFHHYVHCAHILHGLAMSRATWPSYPDKYLNALTAGCIASADALREQGRRRAPLGFESVKLVGQARRKQLPRVPCAPHDLSLSSTLGLLLGVPSPELPEHLPHRGIPASVTDSIYRNAIRLNEHVMLDAFNSNVSFEDLNTGRAPLIDKREYRALIGLAAEADNGLSGFDWVSRLPTIEFPVDVDSSLRWHLNDSNSAEVVLAFLHFLGALRENLSLRSPNPAAHEQLVDRYRVSVSQCEALLFKQSRLSVKDGLLVDVTNMEGLRLRGREDIQVFQFAISVWQGVQASTDLLGHVA